MGLNFHKSVKVNDNTKVNLNKKSASVTVGTKGVHHTVSTSGRRTTTVGLPGTGLSYTMSSGGQTNTKKKSSKKNSSKTIKAVISVICSIVALVFIIIGVIKYFGIGSSKNSLSWRKDEYSVSVGKSTTLIIETKGFDNMSNAKAADFTIEIDDEDAVTVQFKQAYSETVHFTATGVEEGAATIKITYNGTTSGSVTVNVTE